MLIGIKDFTRCKNVRERVRCSSNITAIAIAQFAASNVSERFANARAAGSVLLRALVQRQLGKWGPDDNRHKCSAKHRCSGRSYDVLHSIFKTS